MSLKELIIFLLCVSVILFSCGKLHCVLYIDDSLRAYTDVLFIRHPLPEEYTAEITNQNPARAQIIITHSIRSTKTYKREFFEKVVSRQ